MAVNHLVPGSNPGAGAIYILNDFLHDFFFAADAALRPVTAEAKKFLLRRAMAARFALEKSYFFTFVSLRLCIFGGGCRAARSASLRFSVPHGSSSLRASHCAPRRIQVPEPLLFKRPCSTLFPPRLTPLPAPSRLKQKFLLRRAMAARFALEKSCFFTFVSLRLCILGGGCRAARTLCLASQPACVGIEAPVVVTNRFANWREWQHIPVNNCE